MTDEQFKAFLNAVMSEFGDTIKAVSKNSSDHDLLIKIDTRLEQALSDQSRNHKEFLSHKLESVSVRDDVKAVKDYVEKCKRECRGDTLKRHDLILKVGVWVVVIITGVSLSAFVKAFWSLLIK